MADRERDLEAAVDDLTETLEALRTELDESRRGPFGLPRPPSLGEFLQVTEQYTIPALVSFLETNIRVLELLAATIRVVDGRPLDGETGSRRGGNPGGTDRLAAVSRRTLRTLDDALADVQSAAAGGSPENPEVQRLLEEARGLRREVDERLADVTRAPGHDDDPEPTQIEIRDDDAGRDAGDVGDAGGATTDADHDEPSDGAAPESVGVDVEGELESIKRDLENVEADPTSVEARDDDPDSREGTVEEGSGEDASGDETPGDDEDAVKDENAMEDEDGDAKTPNDS